MLDSTELNKVAPLENACSPRQKPHVIGSAITIAAILPTFRRGRVLCETIRMLLDQTKPPDEIIVVDQTEKHPDDVSEALDVWRASGTIRMRTQEAKNASMARNAGALLATSEVLLFLDDDIRINDSFIESHLRNYERPSVHAVAGQILEGEGESVSSFQHHEDRRIEWMHFPRNYDKACNTTWMASGNMSVRRDVYFEVGGMDENYFQGAYREESDFAMRLLRKGYSFRFDPEASIYHLAVPGVGGTRKKSWTSYWFHMYGFWYFVIGNVPLACLHHHLWHGFRYFIFNKNCAKRPWRIPVYAIQLIAMLPYALWFRLKGPRTLSLKNE